MGGCPKFLLSNVKAIKLDQRAVNIVKHLRSFPSDSLSQAIDNVFDFDVYNSELRQTVGETLKKYDLSPSEGVLLRSRGGNDYCLSLTR